MALFGSIFKGRAEKKEDPKESRAPAAPVTAPPPQVAAPSTQKTAVSAPPPPREKPMQLEEIVAALQQIETLMAESSVVPPSDDSGSSDRLQTVAMSLRDIAEVVPSSFVDAKAVSGEKADVVIEDLFDQMAKGKIETTLGYLLAGVPRQYLANPAETKSEMKVLLPLAAVVAAVDPAELKKRTGSIRQDRIASELPNLFKVSPSAAPAAPAAASASAAEKPAASTAKPAESVTLNLKISELKAVLPSTFKSAMVPPDARVDVVMDEIFEQLAKGSVKLPMNKLLAAVPKTYLSAGAKADSEELVTLPLSIVVAAIPPDELKKRTAEVPTKSAVHDLPDLFKLAEPAPAQAASKPAPAPKPVAPTPAVSKPTPPPSAPIAPAPKPDAPAPAVSKPAPPPSAPIAPAPKPDAPTPTVSKPAPPPVAPIAPVPKPAAPAPVAPAPKPVAPTAPPVEAPVAFGGPAPKKFMPMDLVAGSTAAPPPQPPAAKVEKPAPVAMPPAQPPVAKVEPPPVAAPIHAPANLSGVPELLLRGLDLNQATAEELTRVIDGIGDAMAHRIVENRKEHGPFFGLYDLGRVPGIGEKIYERITGQPWLEEKYGQLALVDELLGRWSGKHPRLEDVAEKFRQIAGFEGCIILHRDGDLLATSWRVESPERVQAMAPQILKKVKHYMRHISSTETYSVTVFHEGHSFTFVESEDICFVAVHNPKGLSRRHIQIVVGLGVALGRRFSGYRGA